MKDKQIEEEAERIALRLDPKFRDRYTEPWVVTKKLIVALCRRAVSRAKSK